MKNNFIYIVFYLLTTSISFAEKEVDSLLIQTEANKQYYKTEIPEDKKFENNFQSKYSGNDYNYKTELENKKLNAWDRFIKKISDFFDSLFSFSNNGQAFSTLDIILKILGFAIIGFVIFLIVKLLINKEGGWFFSRNTKKINIGEMSDENIHFINFKDVIAKAKATNDYRIATRYYYLWLLKSLSDRMIIEWDIEKTNSDYLYEIKNAELKKEFEFLSYIYDYCWYGEFELTSEVFLKAENHFMNAIQIR